MGDFPFVLEREDVHMHIEAALIEKLGDVGRKLHTGAKPQRPGRDRRQALGTRRAGPDRRAPDRTFSGRSWRPPMRHRDVILPGYTHMQRAQPVLAASLSSWPTSRSSSATDRGWPIAASG